MDEELYAWKINFNICDAAYFALQQILPGRGVHVRHQQRNTWDAQSRRITPVILATGDIQTMNVSGARPETTTVQTNASGATKASFD